MMLLQKFLKKLGWGKTRLKRQMLLVYVLALLIPLTGISMLFIFSAQSVLSDHYLKILAADNRRVKTLFTDVTKQAYEISNEICFDANLKLILSRDYPDGADFIAAANGYGVLDNILYKGDEIARIAVYTDNPAAREHKQFHRVTDAIAETAWYRRAVSSSGIFWVSIPDDTSYASSKNNLCLVRPVTLPDSPYHAVAVVTVSDSYIRSRVDFGNMIDIISVNDGCVVYSSKRNLYGEQLPVEIDYDDPYFRFEGKTEFEETQYFTAVSTSKLYMSSSKMYICSMDSSGIGFISHIVRIWCVVLLIAVSIPGVVLWLFVRYFTGRVDLLREEMHKARLQDYNIISSFSGNDELTEAFDDLRVMVADIKQKNAKMYEAELAEKELRNKQQLMEYKMLASQINPHYLYNTLETIRMKALTAGNRDVADSIKILGKTLHYVVENTGTAFTSLQAELDYVENYLAIQKLRFGDRVNYTIEVDEGLDTASYSILPLLVQPVVENAVVHGLEGISGAGVLQILVYLENPQLLRITVADNGIGMTESELQELRAKLKTPGITSHSSVALYNIHQRIRLCYGDGYGVTIDSVVGQGTMVTLNLRPDFRERA